MKLPVCKLYLVSKRDAATWAFRSGMGLIYLGSLFPWFLWSTGGAYIGLSAVLLVAAMLMDRKEALGLFSRKDFLMPILAYMLISFYIIFVNGESPKNLVINLFHIVIYLTLFRADTKELPPLADFIAKGMGWLLLVSMVFFLAYLMGFPLPSVNASFRDGFYSFSNYFFFLIDDRSFVFLIPRFQAVFLEPGHLGTATSFLLLTQCGKWRRWYNVVLLTATLITFSLSAYVLLTAVIIMHLWVQRRNILGKLVAITLVFAAVITASFFYRDGDNMLHDLIILRLEVEDGELAGNNRVTEDFQSEFDSFMQSGDILFGRGMDYEESGNSGYQVFIYDNGLVGLFLLWAFYVVSMWAAPDRRCFLAVMFVALLAFLARGYLMWYNYYIPFYCMAFLPLYKPKAEGLPAPSEPSSPPREMTGYE